MANKTFGFWAAFKDAYCSLLTHKHDWIKIACGPWVITFLGSMVALLFFPPIQLAEGGEIPWFSALGNVGLAIVMFGASIMFTIRALRFRILGEVPSDFISFEWNSRHWKYVLFSIALGLGVGGIPALIAIFAGPLFALVVFIAVLFFVLRLGFVGPIIAIDGGNLLAGSWKATRGWTWVKLFAVLLAVLIPAVVALNIFGWIVGFVHPVAEGLFSQLFAGYVIAALLNSVIAYCYKEVA